MKSFVESLLIYFVIGAAGVFSAITISFLALGEGNPAGMIALLVGLLALLIVQAASKPSRLALFGAAIGLAWGTIVGMWFTAGLMQDSIMFVENYAMPANDLPVGGVVLTVACLVIGWAAYGISAFVRRRRSVAA